MPQRLSLKPFKRYPNNSYMGLSVPTDLKARMAQVQGINWSLLFQIAVRNRLAQLEQERESSDTSNA